MKLQIIKTDKGYVALNKELADIGKPYLMQGIGTEIRIRGEKNDISWTKWASKIIATDTSFKLEGIPQFELEKAAQEKGCYTEEDLRKAFDRGEWDGAGKSEVTRNAVFDNFIDSLKQAKRLVAIEVETERRNVFDIDEQGQMAYNTITDFKISNGFLTVKQYYYE